MTELLVTKLSEVEGIPSGKVLLANPGAEARFPCCVIHPPLQVPKYHGGAWELSVTVEIWSEKQYEAMRLFDLAKAKLLDYNFMLANTMPMQQDTATQKWRYGGYFEVRWNAVQNRFEQNR